MNLRHALSFVAVTGLALPCGGAAAQGAKAPQRASTTVADGSALNQAIDSYDPATRILTIPLVQVGARYYRDVQITVGAILSVGVAKGPSGVFDSRRDRQSLVRTLTAQAAAYFFARCARGCAASYAFARCWKSSRV
jgi:hypothetical protein